MDALLLHICCAPCGGGCVERLLREGRKVTLYFANSNIDSAEEFARRLDSVKLLAGINKLDLLVDPYEPEAFSEMVRGLEDEPEKGRRCALCFTRNFRKTDAMAKQLGMNWTTTLTVSPHKPTRMIFEAAAFSQRFEPYDFKKQNGFLRSRQLAAEHEFYLQNYCGCSFSKRKQPIMPVQKDANKKKLALSLEK